LARPSRKESFKSLLQDIDGMVTTPTIEPRSRHEGVFTELTKDLGKRTTWKGRSVRPLNPLAEEDVRLLEAVSRGEFLIAGFRNRDLRDLLFHDQPATTELEAKRQSTKVTRLLRLLRAHGLIAKIAKTHRYQVSEKGQVRLSALLAARRANTKQLLQAA
jgi:hypothetical protein